MFGSSLQLFVATLGLANTAFGQLVQPVVSFQGTSASSIDLSQVTLNNGRFHDNQARTIAYLKFVDLNRLLYNFRSTHKLSTQGAATNGGWDAPTFPFRSHMQGHFLSAWAQCYASTGDTTCKDRATTFVAELAKCQANNAAAGFTAGYLSGFPESEFANLEAGKLTSGNVPYYCVHKTMAGLFDVWIHTGNTQAKDVLLAMAGWVDTRTSKLSTSTMQAVLGTEHGGMLEVLSNIYAWTGNSKWLTTAARFDHTSLFDPLSNNVDQLNGQHANTNIPKWIGAARQYKTTGTTKWKNVAQNAWNIVVSAHTYAIGGNSDSEHFHEPNGIASHLTNNTAESCNTYNMLKLTRELWAMNPSNTTYFDYYERAVLNQMLGQQNPSDSHGHVTYFTALNAGGHRGIGPAWGGGTWSTDYNSMWCCQGTGIETHTKFMDSIYGTDDSGLYVNLFLPSVLNYSQKGVTITQATNFPISDNTTLKVTGSGTFAMMIRVPNWTSGATITINGASAGVSVTPGQYAKISRTWASGDTIVFSFPMSVRTIVANDNHNMAAVAYGPTILSGNYGSQTLSSTPTLSLKSVKRSSSSSLDFTATTSSGSSVKLGPFYDAQGFNYVVYWNMAA